MNKNDNNIKEFNVNLDKFFDLAYKTFKVDENNAKWFVVLVIIFLIISVFDGGTTFYIITLLALYPLSLVGLDLNIFIIHSSSFLPGLNMLGYAVSVLLLALYFHIFLKLAKKIIKRFKK